MLSDEYSIYRKDRGSRAGGVLIGVKTSSFKNVEQYLEPSDILQQIEIVSTEIKTLHDQRILFSSCYRPLKPTTHVYKLNNNKLIQTDCERDLGVFVDRNLTWNRQVIEQSSKANKQLGYVKRSTIYVGNEEVKRSLYLTLVRPLLGYATQI